MSKSLKSLVLILPVTAVIFLATPAHSQERNSPRGETFYIVASVDQAKSQLLLKLPTEVTSIVDVGAKTQYVDEAGKGISLSALRAGDTIWLSTSGTKSPVATGIRKGPMTVQELHRYYLDYAEIK
jgi:hypothetical protein